MLSGFSCVQLFVTPWTITHQAPLSMGFSRQEYWSGLPCPPLGDLSDPGIELRALMSPSLAGGSFTISATWEAHRCIIIWKINWKMKPFLYPTFKIQHCCKKNRLSLKIESNTWIYITFIKLMK